MEKRTILAIGISAVILIGSLFLQSILFPPAKQPVTAPAATQVQDDQSKVSSDTSGTKPQATTETVKPADTAAVKDTAATKGEILLDPSKGREQVVALGTVEGGTSIPPYSNGVIRVGFTNTGDINSLELLQHKDKGNPVQMIMPFESNGLRFRFGDRTSDATLDAFTYEPQSQPNLYVFSRTFSINNQPAKSFKVTKKYEFFPNDYLFKYSIIIENSVNEKLPIDRNNFLYTIDLGPQIGPVTSVLGSNQDYRRFGYLTANGAQKSSPAPGSETTVSERLSWAAIDGKYFSFFIIPGAAEFKTTFGAASYDGKLGDQLYLSRPVANSNKSEDVFTIYAGPKLSNQLAKYNKATDNPSGQSNLYLDKIVDADILWWLEEAMKAIMSVFMLLIPNWGVAIILLTILVKALLFPLTRKSMQSNAKMAALAPKIQEMREKYKNDSKKMNIEMAALYKNEKINPLGGCLPLLLQFPFFFAMYALFNNHFDLRGAMFIPGWISDLSVPETIVSFQFIIPIFGTHVSGLHLLPFVYVATQILSAKFTQMQNPTTSNGQMKFMMYGLPAVFFFILYETPSGLVVYWIFQNVISVVQQRWMNKHLAAQKAAASEKSSSLSVVKPKNTGIAPKKPKKK